MLIPSIRRRNRILANAALFAAASTLSLGFAEATPLVNINLLGMDLTQGGTSFSSSLASVSAGDTVEFQILTFLSATGTSNANAPAFTSKTNNVDGINSLKFDLYELSSDQIQANFLNAVAASTSSGTTLAPAEGLSLKSSPANWKGITGANGGSLSLRPSTSNNDLFGIRPGLAPAVYRGITSTQTAAILGTGLFVVGTLGSGAATAIRMRWSAGALGGFQINGSSPITISSSTESSSDPFVGFTSLSLNGTPSGSGPSGGYATEWIQDYPGYWGTGASWSNGVPNGNNNSANFFGGILQTRRIEVDGSYTASSINFDNSNSYTLAGITGVSSLTLQTQSGPAGVTVSNGSHYIGAPITLVNASTVFTVSPSDMTLSLAGAIGGVGPLVKAGAGTLRLSGSNSYSVGTAINAGTVLAATISALPAGGALTVDSGATLNLDGYSASVGALTGAGAIQLETGSTPAWRTATLTAGLDNSNKTFSGTISGSGGLTKAGNGTLTLSGTHTYTGKTYLSNGTLTLSGANLLSDVSGVVLSEAANTTFDLGGHSQGIGSLTSKASTSGTNQSVLLGAGTLTIGNANINTEYRGYIGGTGGLIKVGIGIQGLHNAAQSSNFANGTKINGGILGVYADADLGQAPGSPTDGQIELNAPDTGEYGSYDFSDFNHNRYPTLSNYANTSFTLSANRNVAINAPFGRIQVLNSATSPQQNAEMTIAGVIKPSSTNTLIKTGAGTLVLTQPIDGAGPVIVSSGTLRSTVNSSGGTPFGTGTVLQAGQTVTYGDPAVTVWRSPGKIEFKPDAGGGNVSYNVPELFGGLPGSEFILNKNGNTSLTVTAQNQTGFSQAFHAPLGGMVLVASDLGGTEKLFDSLAYNTDPVPGAFFGKTPGVNGTYFFTAYTNTYGFVNATPTYSTTYADWIDPGQTGDLVTGGRYLVDGAHTFAAGSDFLIGAGTILLTAGSSITSSVGFGSEIFLMNDGSSISATKFECIADYVAGTATIDAAIVERLGKYGPGTLILPHSGIVASLPVIIGDGTLQLNATDVFNGSTDITLTGTGVLSLNTASQTIGDLIGYTQSCMINLNGGTLTNSGNSDTTFLGQINGSGTFIKTGSGVLTLGYDANPLVSTINTMNHVQVLGGILEVGFDTALGAIPTSPMNDAVTLSGGTLRWTGYTIAGGDASTSLAVNRGIALGTSGGTIEVAKSLETLIIPGVISGTGSLSKTGPGTMRLSATNTYAGNTLILGGILSISSSANLGNAGGGNNIVLDNAATLQVTNSITTSRSVTVNSGGGTIDTAGVSSTFSGAFTGSGTLTKSSAGTLHVTALKVGGLTINDGVVHVLASGRSNASTSVLFSTPVISEFGQLDLEDNALIVDYSSEGSGAVASIRNLLINGRNSQPAEPARWNGLGGITSSYARSNGNGFNLSIGYADNAVLAGINAAGSYTSFAGQTISSTTILIRMTRGADCNMDEVVDGTDVSIIGTHFNQPGSGQWYYGDFDYSGECDGNDISVLGTSYGQTSPTLSPAQLTAEFGSAFTSAFESGANSSAVPEPASFLAIGLAGLVLMTRGRTRRTTPKAPSD